MDTCWQGVFVTQLCIHVGIFFHELCGLQQITVS
jgi:hypothetical protein